MNPVAGLTLVAAFTSLTAMMPAPQSAQPLPRNGAADSVHIAQMKSALRSLVGAEEAHYADRGTYTTDMTALRTVGKLLIATDSVRVTVIFAGGRGWTGTAMFRGMAKVRCVVYVGDPEDLPKVPKTFGQQSPSSEGAITCDTP
jgi:hypothetical protein